MANLKTVEGLRDFLANELERVASNDTTPATANAAANLAGKILGSVKMELEYNKMAGSTPNISFLNTDKVRDKKMLEADNK